MGLPQLIVWERGGLWALRLRRALHQTGVAIREVRSRAECLERLAESPGSVVAIEFRSEASDQVLATLWDIERWFPRARSGILTEQQFADYAPQAFEAGARWFIMSVRRLPLVARFIVRHLELADIFDIAADAGSAIPWTKDTTGQLLASLLDDLFNDLEHTQSDRPRRLAIEQLTAQLPAVE